MKCEEVRELLPVYSSLPADGAERLAVDQHVAGCEACSEEFAFWEQSEKWMHDEPDELPAELFPGPEVVSSHVMSRIYTDESWRLPVSRRMYSMSDKMRRNMMLCIAFCLALFVGSFLYALIGRDRIVIEETAADKSAFTIQMPQKLDSGIDKHGPSYNVNSTAISVSQSFLEPIPFQMGPIRSYSNFLLIVSIIGFIGAMLVLNWFNRVKT